MPCDHNEEHLNLFLDGQLETSQQVELFKHLSECADCRGFLDAATKFRKMASLEQVQYPASLDESLFEELFWRKRAYVRSVQREHPQPFWARRVSVPLAAAAVMIVSLIVGTLGGFSLGLRAGRVNETARVSSMGESVPVKVIFIYALPEVVVPAFGPGPQEAEPIPPIRTQKKGEDHDMQEHRNRSGFADLWSTVL